jgi:hypothetical protein
VQEPPTRFHPLAPDIQCPTCRAGLKFVRVRGGRDLYQCTFRVCQRQFLHYRNNETQTCGYAPVYSTGVLGKWTACGETAARGGDELGAAPDTTLVETANRAGLRAPSTATVRRGRPFLSLT